MATKSKAPNGWIDADGATLILDRTKVVLTSGGPLMAVIRREDRPHAVGYWVRRNGKAKWYPIYQLGWIQPLNQNSYTDPFEVIEEHSWGNGE